MRKKIISPTYTYILFHLHIHTYTTRRMEQLFPLKYTPHPLRNKKSPKTECGCLHGGVIENGRECNPLTLCSVPVHVMMYRRVCTYRVTLRVHLRNATTATNYFSIPRSHTRLLTYYPRLHVLWRLRSTSLAVRSWDRLYTQHHK